MNFNNNHSFYKRFLLLCVMLCAIVTTGIAQDFYYIEYDDLEGNECFGLITWNDEQNITMRVKAIDDNDDVAYQKDLKYHTETAKDGNTEYLMLVTDTQDNLEFAFGYGGQKFSDDNVTPYVSIGDADLFEAKEFSNIPLTDMNSEFISLFYDEDDPQYRQLLAAVKSAKEGESTVAANLGDGEAIFETVISQLAEIQGKSKQDLTDNYVETNSVDTPAPTSSATLHLMIVANTTVDDIGAACHKDYDHVLGEMKSVARALNIPLKQYPVTGTSLSRDGVVEALDRIHPGPNDIVVFLYSGHGFRFDDQESRFPQMDLTQDAYQELGDNYLAMADVFDAIRQKGARLNIVMSDCCNTPYGEDTPVGGGTTLYSRASSNFSLDRLRQLFLNTSGSILSTASSPGETSICDESGGFYTIGFIRSLRKEVSVLNEEPVSWVRVMDNTIEAAKERSERDGDVQHGIRMVRNE